MWRVLIIQVMKATELGVSVIREKKKIQGWSSKAHRHLEEDQRRSGSRHR